MNDLATVFALVAALTPLPAVSAEGAWGRSSALSSDAASCESLQALALPDTTILSASLVPAGPFTPPSTADGRGGQTAKPLQIPSACRVVARVTPAVNIEVWMPASNWNGKFQAVGGGGFAGVISYGAMATALGRGYATASTDTGHSTPGGSWALGHPELVTDFAYRAIHEMTVKAKALIAAFYGSDPRLSYFVGCSTGGRQGLMEAQRFPNDYDGIVAGAPANFWTHMVAGSLWPAAATLKDPATRLPAEKLAVLNKAALAACDAGDGIGDGLIGNPQRCRFDPKAIRCSGADSDACLTAPQVEAARKIYSSAVNPRTKAEIFPGMAPGSEVTWGALAGGSQPFPIPVDFYRYFVFSDPNWDWTTFDFDKDLAAGDEKFAKVINATDPNLTAFKARGGKLVMYHGWNDQLIQPFNSVNYYTSVSQAMGAKETDDFARLFMAPGMTHCAGGPGPNTFDAVGALEQWVEHGTKPAQMTASHSTNGVVDRTRPLCPYPQVATFTGVGSIDDAVNFVCSAPGTAWFGARLPMGLGDPHRPVVEVSSATPKQAIVPAGEERNTELSGTLIRRDLERIVGFSKENRASGEKAWGRITGFQSALAAMNWAAERFRAAGLSNIQVQRYDATGQLWYARTWEARVLPEATFGAGSNAVVLESAVPTGGSQIAGGTLTAPLVFAGDTTDGPVTVDVKGKVAVQHLTPASGAFSERTRVSTRAREMASKGALAVINVVEQTGNMYVRDFGNCGAPCFNIGAADGAFLEEVIASAARAGRDVRIQLSLQAELLTGLTGQNVVGIVPGGNEQENIIVNAHGDGWFDAAGDNGDGFAAVLAMARHFAKPENTPARTLVFVISGGHHSTGLNGPANFVRMNPELTKRTVLVLNLEHVAQLAIRPAPWRAESIEQPMSLGISNQSPFLIDLGRRARDRYGFNLNNTFGANVPGDLGGYEPIGVARVQAIHSGPMYHTSGDVLDSISVPGLERAARFFTYFVGEAAKATWREINPSAP